MFRYEIATHFGPFCGFGGYGSETVVGIDKSPKRAFLKAQGRIPGGHVKRSGVDPDTGHCGGGVPILETVKVFRGSQLIKCEWS